jgi:hypothetical protein
MDSQQIKQIILRELPGILQRDPEVESFILRLSRRHFADKEETESRFDRLLDELRRDREEQTRRWEENQQAIRQNQADIRQNQADIRQNQADIQEMLKSIQNLGRRYDSTIGALGARWGLYSEASFRNALKGILEEFFDVQVLNVIEYDEQGEVFGRPDQIELDVIIKDSQLLICEIKSSMSKADMVIFDRKVKFYEKKHQHKASGVLVISPMVHPRAQAVADDLGIQVYSYAEDVDPELFA